MKCTPVRHWQAESWRGAVQCNSPGPHDLSLLSRQLRATQQATRWPCVRAATGPPFRHFGSDLMSLRDSLYRTVTRLRVERDQE